MFRFLLITVFWGVITSCGYDEKSPRIAGAWVGDLIIMKA
jgi:hypothetical protein